jgi:hypothetical protein
MDNLCRIRKGSREVKRQIKHEVEALASATEKGIGVNEVQWKIP